MKFKTGFKSRMVQWARKKRADQMPNVQRAHTEAKKAYDRYKQANAEPLETDSLERMGERMHERLIRKVELADARKAYRREKARLKGGRQIVRALKKIRDA